MNKYAPLTQYLRECKQERVTLAFDELVKLCKIPPNTFQYRSSWCNSKSSNMAKSWLSAGYVVDEISVGDYVTFLYNPERAKKPGAGRKKVALPAPKQSYKNKIVISNTYLEELLDAGESFREELLADPNGRYRSWEYCYSFFASNRVNPDENTKDLLCLNLAFYLASWGMYRGSSFLLQKDYRFHRSAVELLLSPKWEDLWHPSAEFLVQPEQAQKVVDLYQQLNQIYMQAVERDKNLTDTLITKILLGTLGCTPAYDQYFKAAARKVAYKEGLATFKKDSLTALARFYIENMEKFESFRISCNQNGVEYPPMKVLDMCLFTVGLKQE